MTLYLYETTARSKFKDILGQANHLLITNLVGLHAVESGKIFTAPPELRAAWSPKDVTVSARRSRRMLLDMALVRAVDGLDMYIRYSRRKPCLIQNVSLRNAIDGAGNSVYKKLNALTKHYSSLDSVLCVMMEMMIAWRNRSAHFEAENDVSSEKWGLLKENTDRIEIQFSGLCVDRLLKDFDAQNPPTFKEIASLISATHEFIRVLEEAQLAALDKTSYLKDFIWFAISGDSKEKYDKSKTMKRLQSIWGRDEKEREFYVRRFLTNHGLSAKRKYSCAVEYTDEAISELSKHTPSTVYDWCKPVTDEV